MRARVYRFWSDATKMGPSARPYGPRRSILFPPQNYHSQSIGSALRASAFVSFVAFARKHIPNVGSALQASLFEHCKMHQALIFHPFDVRCAVSDMLRSTPTMPSVYIVVLFHIDAEFRWKAWLIPVNRSWRLQVPCYSAGQSVGKVAAGRRIFGCVRRHWGRDGCWRCFPASVCGKSRLGSSKAERIHHWIARKVVGNCQRCSSKCA